MIALLLTMGLGHADTDLPLHGAVRVGATWGRSGLGPGPALRLSGGMSLERTRFVWMPQLALGLSQASASGVVIAPDDSSWTWQTRSRDASVGAGLVVRVRDTSPRIQPELSAHAGLHLVVSETSGTGAGGALTPATELRLRPGVRVGAGVAIDAGPGEVLVDVAAGWVPVDGDLTGSASGWLLLPSVGYRVHR